MPPGYAIPLGASFRFVHEPLDCSGDTHLKRFVGRKDELEEIVARLLLSNGGAFLVTGYRGVGKSTFVNRVLEELRLLLPTMAASLGPLRLVDVHVNVPRAMDSIELMFHVLRGLYLRLSALNLLTSLEPALRRDLELAFSRTSRTIALKTSSGIEGRRTRRAFQVTCRVRPASRSARSVRARIRTKSRISPTTTRRRSTT
jgi:serine/threonine-protein kinase